MRAAVRSRFGHPRDVIELRELERPTPADDEVLVKVRATSVNIAEWYAVTGRPWIARPTMGMRRPKNERLGVDYAGTVEAVGKDVTEFAPGDEVFGGRDGAYADYVCVREQRAIVPKPPTVTFDQAAALGTAALTALQGLRDKGGLQQGQKVLIHGASGGVGAQRLRDRDVWRAAHGGHMSAERLRDLHGVCADPARRAMDEHPLPVFEPTLVA